MWRKPQWYLCTRLLPHLVPKLYLFEYKVKVKKGGGLYGIEDHQAARGSIGQAFKFVWDVRVEVNVLAPFQRMGSSAEGEFEVAVHDKDKLLPLVLVGYRLMGLVGVYGDH